MLPASEFSIGMTPRSDLRRSTRSNTSPNVSQGVVTISFPSIARAAASLYAPWTPWNATFIAVSLRGKGVPDREKAPEPAGSLIRRGKLRTFTIYDEHPDRIHREFTREKENRTVRRERAAGKGLRLRRRLLPGRDQVALRSSFRDEIGPEKIQEGARGEDDGADF